MWIDIFNLLLSFQSFKCWVSRHEHWISPWCMPIPRACAWYPRPIYITDNITSVPVSEKWQAFLLLESNLLCDFPNLSLLLYYFLSLKG